MFLSEPTDLHGPRGKHNLLRFSYFGCSSGIHTVTLHLTVVVLQEKANSDSMLEAISVTGDLLFIVFIIIIMLSGLPGGPYPSA